MSMDLEKPQSRPNHRGQGRYSRLHESDLVRAADAELGQVDLLELDQGGGQHDHLILLDGALLDPQQQLSDPRAFVYDQLQQGRECDDVLNTLETDLLKTLKPWHGENFDQLQRTSRDEVELELEVCPEAGSLPHLSPPPEHVDC